MDFLDIPGLNIAQESGGKGWNPANGVPFCARAYICRPRPLGPLGAILKEGSTPGALSTIRCGWHPPSQPMRSEKRYSPGTLPNQAFRASPAPRGHRPPSGGKFELLLPRARRKHVIWAPLGELRALIEVRMHELLSLPRSARRADGDETRSRAKSGEAGAAAAAAAAAIQLTSPPPARSSLVRVLRCWCWPQPQPIFSKACGA